MTKYRELFYRDTGFVEHVIVVGLDLSKGTHIIKIG